MISFKGLKIIAALICIVLCINTIQAENSDYQLGDNLSEEELKLLFEIISQEGQDDNNDLDQERRLFLNSDDFVKFFKNTSLNEKGGAMILKELDNLKNKIENGLKKLKERSQKTGKDILETGNGVLEKGKNLFLKAKDQVKNGFNKMEDHFLGPWKRKEVK